MALVATYQHGRFCNADAFIALVGMDVRVRQSGRWRGQSKLTKKGDPEVRSRLFNAALQGRRDALSEPDYLAMKDRGLSTTGAFVPLDLKLARVA